ncbi:MAG: D-aminoacyl-tRNA deacylase [Rhodothermales bacterium]
MVALIQRVKNASVTVQDEIVGSIEKGLLILLGVHVSDTAAEVKWLAKKCANLRIFQDEENRMNRSVLDISGQVLVVSQFTLYGNASKGNRPSFVDSAHPDIAIKLYEYFIAELNGYLKSPVETGVFGAMMDVSLVNDGPVTLWVEKKTRTAKE